MRYVALCWITFVLIVGPSINAVMKDKVSDRLAAMIALTLNILALSAIWML